jgi:hypothetical protein
VKVQRRGFILGGLGVAAVAAIGVWGADVATESEIVSGVRRRLAFLRFDDAGLHSFAKDYIRAMLAKRPSWYRWKYHFYSLFHKPAAQWGMSNDNRSRRERLEDSLATLFLLSSDFFIKGADESRVIQYLNFYDPLRSCSSPFARPVIVPENLTS